jgi:UDPglucose 6-dehydrogenase
MKIAVIGTGYVGLVSGVCFAETGNSVICVDIDQEKVNKLNQKICTIFEPGLELLLERNVDQGRLTFTTDLENAVSQSQIIFLALPTPPGEDGSADLSYILNMAAKLGNIITDYKVIVDKSTVPVGTADKVRQVIAQNQPTNQEGIKVDFDVVSNPEFLREGMAVEDFLKPDRVVIGTTSPRAKDLMERLYKPYVRQGNPIIFMDERSAELTKYAANSFLATKISFMNEIANLCELVDADVDMVRRGIGTDNRIGNRFLFAGIGYGGSCFPKDVLALHKTSLENEFDFKLLNSVLEVNQRQKELFLNKILDYFKGDVKGKKIALWGLAFKPNTDDIREAPAIYLIEELLKAGASIKLYDPEAMENGKRIFGDAITFCQNMYEATEDADFLVIVTEWTVFRSPDFELIKQNLKLPIIFDGRNLYDLETLVEQGFSYFSIGRKQLFL